MDESTAASHLLAKKDPQLPSPTPTLARVRTVVVLVTVDRQGVICDLRPLAGPLDLRRAALKAVKDHWRYRPFLVDWKPVVAQFPVSVKFMLAKREPLRMALRRPGASRASIRVARHEIS